MQTYFRNLGSLCFPCKVLLASLTMSVSLCGALFTRGRGTNFPPLYSLHTKLWRQRKIGLAAQRRKPKAISHDGLTEKEGKEIYGGVAGIPVAWQGWRQLLMTLHQQQQEQEEEKEEEEGQQEQEEEEEEGKSETPACSCCQLPNSTG